MPQIVAANNAVPSTLIDVLGQVREAFDASGDATPIMIGGQYIAQWGEGNGPRVLFVPEGEGSGGELASARALGNVAAHVHGCNVYIRGAEETSDDLTRFRLAYALSDRVADFVKTAGAGAITWGRCGDDSPLRVSSGAGAGLAWSFTYSRDIRHDVARWVAPVVGSAGPLPSAMTTPVDPSPPFLPTSPAALPAAASTITITVTPSE